MENKAKVGIWMDHQVANLMEYSGSTIQTQTVKCEFDHQSKEEALSRGEETMHTKEQGEQADYYWELAKLIRKYNDVLLFGPTNAKTELYNTFKNDNLYAKIKVEIRTADKLTENQQHAFVREYFELETSEITTL